MRKEDFFEVIGELDDDIVKGAKTSMKENTNSKVRKYGWFKWGAVAACLCIAVVGAAVFSQQSSLNTDDITIGGEHGVDGGNEGIMYSVAVYPATKNEGNVSSADVITLTENEAMSNPLAKHLPRQFPEGFHYGHGSIYNTVMKDGTQYNMLRIEYISGEIPQQHFTEDGGAIAPDVDTVGEVFIVCVMNYEPDTNSGIYSSAEEVTLSLLEESRGVSIRTGDCYVSVFIDTAEPAAVFEALKTIV